jgi:hypothetical protein
MATGLRFLPLAEKQEKLLLRFGAQRPFFCPAAAGSAGPALRGGVPDGNSSRTPKSAGPAKHGIKNRWTLRFVIGAMASLALCASSLHAAELPPEKDPLKDELLGPAMQAVEEENGEAQTQPEEKAKLKPKADERPSRDEEEDEEPKEENGDDKKFKLGKYFQFGGAIEVEAAILNDFEEPWHGTIELTAFELDFEFTPTDWINALLVIELVDYTKVEVKEGFATFGGTEEHPYYLRGGRLFVPFGLGSGAALGDTLSVTDSLTIETFETRKEVIMCGRIWNGFDVAAYFSNGTRGQFGATIRYGIEKKKATFSFSAGLDFISSVFETDALSEEFPEALETRYAPGLAAHVRVFKNGFSLIMEFDTALSKTSFTQEGEALRLAPMAWMIEVGYARSIFGKETYFAINYSESYDLQAAFPRSRLLVSIGRWIYKDMIRLAFEYGHNVDYPDSSGGTGRTADSFLSQLAIEW